MERKRIPGGVKGVNRSLAATACDVLKAFFEPEHGRVGEFADGSPFGVDVGEVEFVSMACN